jgi:hypothetical protein
MPKIPVIERFFKRFTIPKNENECWLWTGGKDRDGYGQINSSREKGVARKCLRAHRISYEHFIGEIPEGYFICHTCDNPSCVNPKHLWAGTATDNNRDCAKKGRTGKFRPEPKRGEKNHNAKLNIEDVRKIRKLREQGSSCRLIASNYSVTPQAIRAICDRKVWKHVD